MGGPKLLLSWGKTSVLGHLIDLWKEIGARQIAVVCAREDALIEAELNQLGFPSEGRIVNPDPARGMFSSIQCAARWTGWQADVTHWAIALGDQPQIKPSTLRALLDFAAQHPADICQPSRVGRARHPVILPTAPWRELAASSAATLRDFLRTHANEVRLFACDDAGLDVDLNEPADYVRALSGLDAARGHRE